MSGRPLATYLCKRKYVTFLQWKLGLLVHRSETFNLERKLTSFPEWDTFKDALLIKKKKDKFSHEG